MILNTDRLVLRDFTDNDWPAVLAYQNNPEYLRYYVWESRTPADVRAFVQRFLDQQMHKPRTKFQLAITLRNNDTLIGNCGLRLEAAGALVADVGYELDPIHWNNGYATEAARAVLCFGFTKCSLHRIWATCIAENVASARVLEKVGMRQEGCLRENEYFKGRWWDTLLYGILASEWLSLQF